jgi:hypothetical protein
MQGDVCREYESMEGRAAESMNSISDLASGRVL